MLAYHPENVGGGGGIKVNRASSSNPLSELWAFPQDLPENWVTVFWGLRSPSEKISSSVTLWHVSCSLHMEPCDACYTQFTCNSVTCVIPAGTAGWHLDFLLHFAERAAWEAGWERQRKLWQFHRAPKENRSPEPKLSAHDSCFCVQHVARPPARSLHLLPGQDRS